MIIKLLIGLFVFQCFGLIASLAGETNASALLVSGSNLLQMVRRIKPWSDNAHYTKADWRIVEDVARAVQQARPQVVSNALAQFIQEARWDPTEETKPFILLRMVFDLPTNAPPNIGFSFSNFRRFSSDTNSDGTLNLSWPLVWENGKPHFCARFMGAEGPPPYRADKEFEYMVARFKYRSLGKKRPSD